MTAAFAKRADFGRGKLNCSWARSQARFVPPRHCSNGMYCSRRSRPPFDLDRLIAGILRKQLAHLITKFLPDSDKVSGVLVGQGLCPFFFQDGNDGQRIQAILPALALSSQPECPSNSIELRLDRRLDPFGPLDLTLSARHVADPRTKPLCICRGWADTLTYGKPQKQPNSTWSISKALQFSCLTAAMRRSKAF